MITLFVCITPLLLAETNALIEVKLFKDWVIKGERSFGNFNLSIKNTGTSPILLTQTPFHFQVGQLVTRPLPHNPNGDWEQQEKEYQLITWERGAFFNLLPEETHIYEGQKFYLMNQLPFSEEMRFTVSVYLGKGFWLDSVPQTVYGIVPDSVEQLTMIKDNTRNLQDPPRKLVVITHKNERWLYVTNAEFSSFFSICPFSLTNKIRVEPHDGAGLFKIWDGDKSMIFDMYKMMLTEGPDENNVYGKWTRERKQKAEADNAEVRHKKVEAVQAERGNAQTTPAEIAKSDNDPHVRQTAIGILNDQTVLAEIARNDASPNVRLSAIEKLNSQGVLAGIAKSDSVSNVRVAAMDRLYEQEALVEVAKNAKDSWIRQHAVRKLTDQVLLGDFAKNDNDGEVRRAAVPKLNDQTLLAEIARDDKAMSVRVAATVRLTNQVLLAETAKNDKDSDMRIAATYALTDQASLAEIAKNDKDSGVRQTAVRKLNSQNLLAEIVMSDKDKWVHQAATERLNQLKREE